MKKTILILMLMAGVCLSKSQTISFHQEKAPTTVYLGLSTGIENYAGMLGVGGEIRLTDLLFLRAGVGLGGWGYKFGVGIKYETKQTNNWGYGIYYTQSSGAHDYKTSLEVFADSSRTNTIKKDVTLDLLKASSLNLAISHNWILRHNNKFYIEFGYAVPLTNKPYKVKDGSTLNDYSESFLKIMQPGGLIISAGFLFALD